MIPEEVYIPSISSKNFIKTYGSFYPNFSVEQFEQNILELEVPQTKNLRKLSFGQQKKFIISFGLACNTEVLVMDEPTNGLDIPSKSQFRKLMAKSISAEKIFIISTHQVRDLDNILDHIIVVNNGGLILDASIREIEDKLAFNFYQTRPENETLAIDEMIGGFAVIERNIDKQESHINLEQLFNTAIIKTEEIKNIFNN